ncbi:MAG: hypothetical protein ABI342_07200 [Nitrososphaera sp.]|jgi:hypothetical protein
MTDFYEYSKDILVVAIPSIMGAFTSKRIVNSWQTNTEKFKLRRQILSDYQKSYIRQYSEMATLGNLIYGNYITELKWNKTEEGKFTTVILFPTNKTEQPFEKFSNKYKEYQAMLKETTKDTWDFYATLQLYHKNLDLEKKLSFLSNQRALCEMSLEILFRTETSEELKMNFQKFSDEFTKYRTHLHDFRNTLIGSKIRSPDEHWLRRILRKKKTIKP